MTETEPTERDRKCLILYMLDKLCQHDLKDEYDGKYSFRSPIKEQLLEQSPRELSQLLIQILNGRKWYDLFPLE